MTSCTTASTTEAEQRPALTVTDTAFGRHTLGHTPGRATYRDGYNDIPNNKGVVGREQRIQIFDFLEQLWA
ncbi:unnamed protein product [Toxocara canis]|uniref:Cytochrome c n=1 Tax=Toxocara canis TaxID=6265 RepID=A0A183UIU4_TOXCA|nr:unnamed protein product [Toxocara canis]